MNRAKDSNSHCRALKKLFSKEKRKGKKGKMKLTLPRQGLIDIAWYGYEVQIVIYIYIKVVRWLNDRLFTCIRPRPACCNSARHASAHAILIAV